VDVTGQRIVVHRNPHGGTYSDVNPYGVGGTIAPLSAPENAFAVQEAFDPDWGFQH
jgi:hypothetical protein